jgi:RimJ/RimL family protein N-acetyltransferase
VSLFKTQRLIITPLSRSFADSSKFLQQIPQVLTTEVTKTLPISWQQVEDEMKGRQWLNDRLSEGIVCSITNSSNERLIGFLFLYEQELISARLTQASEPFLEVRIGYLLAEQHWGKGLASELIAGLISYYKERGNVSCLVGGVELSNIGSIKVLTKNGFELKDTNGDTGFFQLDFTGHSKVE